MLIGFDEGCNGIVNFVVSLWQKYLVETVVSTTVSSSSGYNVSPVEAEQSRAEEGGNYKYRQPMHVLAQIW